MDYKNRFLELLLENRVLQFGSFKTKSGRISPYFFNSGNFSSGRSIAEVAKCYAHFIRENWGDEVTNLFGPAYKGIPLCVAVSEQLVQLLNRDIGFTFNRKEAKAHGEGGNLVGASYAEHQNVVVVEDVLTGGTSLRETMSLVQGLPVKVLGAIVGVDRMERGQTQLSASKEIEKDFKVPVKSILRLDEIVNRLLAEKVLGKEWIDAGLKVKIDRYFLEYGVRDSSR